MPTTSSQPGPGPALPTRTQAARIVTEASNDPGWGMFVWLAMTTGTRPAELCAARWADLDLDDGGLTVRSRADQADPVALDAQTIRLVRAYQAHCAAQAAMLGIERRHDAYVFSPTPDGGMAPDTGEFGERYARMCADLGLPADLDHLPQYSATDLFAAGVDELSLNWRLQRGLSRIQRRPR